MDEGKTATEGQREEENEGVQGEMDKIKAHLRSSIKLNTIESEYIYIYTHTYMCMHVCV